ncbi:sigma-54-dependent transcriptional regulator [candidate division CSSED10-310 bacterium]|uniref:Sigma-54-dependent transcriptional regulator n=1 Tax=candidate division CSSED10-310 bacterium TaxID=2855610 RepID=A0ABV6YV45_UNCC1
MARILIIDDDRAICKLISSVADRLGHTAQYTTDLERARTILQNQQFEIIFLDVKMPDGNGLDLLPQIKSSAVVPEVIIITGYWDSNGAELAFKSGVWDYLEKPITVNALTLQITRAALYHSEKTIHTTPVFLKRDQIIGTSPELKTALIQAALVCQSTVNVLITGETGTGKELFARTIHSNSSRSEMDFVVVDCTSLPETLAESILFGHEKGVYTGAVNARDGLFKMADGGTLFLDEIGELPLNMQKTFLRVIQEQNFRPLGSKTEIKSDFRLIAATNKNLEKMVDAGSFRKDLFFRLQTFTINLPPLRHRPDDVKDLIKFYVQKLCQENKIETKELSPDFMDVLLSYDWPGNVREVFNTLDSVFTVAFSEQTLFSQHLPATIRIKTKQLQQQKPLEDEIKKWPHIQKPLLRIPTFTNHKDTSERHYLKEVLEATQGNIQEACSITGLSRSRFYALLKKHRLPTKGKNS